MQIPIISGIFTDATGDYRTSYPRNLVPVPKQTGVSTEYLKTSDGLSLFTTGPGIDRGGIVWDDYHYRVMGTRLVGISVTGAIEDIGEITGSGLVSMDYSFDRLAIVGDQKMWYLTINSGTGVKTLTQVTDTDLGKPIDVVWIDSYFMMTDGTNLIVTELTDPTVIDPLKYGSSEGDPDPVKGLLKFKNEIFAFNRYSIEVFDNTGGTGFPFSRVPSGMVDRGCVGTYAKCLYGDSMAFCGSARNEAVSIFVTNGGNATKIATREIDAILAKYRDKELNLTVFEYRSQDAHKFLYVHLPNETLVYDENASQILQAPAWHILSSSADSQSKYRGRNFVYAYNKWLCGDFFDGRIGIVDGTVATQYGEVAGWQFDTKLGYAEGKSVIVHRMELSGLMGRAPFGDKPTVFASYTEDGMTWSDEKAASMGRTGDRQHRLQWRRLGVFRNVRGMRFRGANKSPIAIARLDADFEQLYA